MNKILISVVVPIYNVKKYLEECIESIIVQTYRNIEILLVDDGSTDGSSEICDSYAFKDNRIRVFHKNNGGLSDARNYGIKRSRGEYLIFVDSDDLVHPEFVEVLLKSCLNNNSILGVCSFIKFNDGPANDLKFSYNEGSTSSYLISGKNYLTNIYKGKFGSFALVAWNKIYHKSLFEYINYPIGRYYEDTFTTYKLLIKSKMISIIDIPLYFYRQREESIMSSQYTYKKIVDLIDGNFYVNEYYDKIKEFELLYYSYSYFCRESVLAYFTKISKINKNKSKDAKHYVRSRFIESWKLYHKINLGYKKKIVYSLCYWYFYTMELLNF